MTAEASQGKGGERTRTGMLQGPRALAVRESETGGQSGGGEG